MIALLLCLIGAVGAFVAGRRALWAGILVVVTYGYFYGILRANFQSAFSHFLFDAALLGLYASQFIQPRDHGPFPKNHALNTWTWLLIGWPVLLLFVPFQTFLVSLVGLRGSIFFLPAIFLGTRLRSEDLRKLAYGFAILNLVVLGFAIAEYFRGIEPFYPPGPLTATIYQSFDATGTSNRIPATFQNAHSYAGSVLATLPVVFGAWVLLGEPRWRKIFLVVGMGAALVGVLMASTRLGIIDALVLALVASFSGKVGSMKRVIWAVAIIGAIWAAMHNDRWQRFKELDSETVEDRIAGSVNRTFLEVLMEYPMGNGLGGGGTSIPYFLASQVNRPIEVENSYATLLLEQGIVGLVLWIGFIGWFMINRAGFVKDQWLTGRKMAWYSCLVTFATGMIGNGMLTSIPGTFVLCLMIGWISVRPLTARATVNRNVVPAVPVPVPVMAPTH